MNFKDLQAEVDPWVRKNFASNNSTSALLGVVEEVGELSHHHLKEQQGIRMHENHVAEARDAVADIIIYLADYCNQRGFDLQEIMEETWAKVKKRDWKKDPDRAHEQVDEKWEIKP